MSQRWRQRRSRRAAGPGRPLEGQGPSWRATLQTWSPRAMVALARGAPQAASTGPLLSSGVTGVSPWRQVVQLLVQQPQGSAAIPAAGAGRPWRPLRTSTHAPAWSSGMGRMGLHISPWTNCSSSNNSRCFSTMPPLCSTGHAQGAGTVGAAGRGPCPRMGSIICPAQQPLHTGLLPCSMSLWISSCMTCTTPRCHLRHPCPRVTAQPTNSTCSSIPSSSYRVVTTPREVTTGKSMGSRARPSLQVCMHSCRQSSCHPPRVLLGMVDP